MRTTTSRALGLLGVLAATATMVACSAEITGPSPSISGEPGATSAEDSPTWPGFTCNEQLDTWIELRGADFSPLAVDVISTDKDPRLVLPTVKLARASSPEGEDDGESFEVVLSATPDETTQVRWFSPTLMSFRISPDLMLPAGVYDVTVSNANGESVTREGAFGVMPRPEVAEVREDLQCIAQGERPLTVGGDHFLVRGDERPTVHIGDQDYPVAAAGDCRSLAAVFGTYQFCRTLDITVGQGDMVDGAHDVSVSNIPPGGCDSLPGEDGVRFFVVPPPAAADIQREPICAEQLDYAMMEVTGTNFLKITVDGEERLPAVTVGAQTFAGASVGGCSPLDGPVHEAAEVCTSVVFAVAAGELPAGELPVTVANPLPAGCDSTEAVGLTVLPPPTLAGIAPQPICTAQGDNVMTLTGAGFATVDGAEPTVTIGANTYTGTASDCTVVEGPAIPVQSCTTLAITVPQGDFPDSGSFEVSVTNPDPAGCTTTETVSLVIVPPPTLTAVVPDYFCAETATASLALTGTGFVHIGEALPTVMIADQLVGATDLEGCTAVPGLTDVETCTGLHVEVPAGLTEASYAVAVVNPDPAGCSSVEDVAVQAFGAPTVATVDPALFCSAGAGTAITVTGTNLFTVDGALPSLVFGDVTIVADAVAGCADVDTVDAATVQRCTSLTATVPDSVPTNTYDVVVLNPAPLGCTNADPGQVQTIVAGGPVTVSHDPPVVCRGQFDGELTLNGTGFYAIDGARPTVNLAGAIPVTVNELLGCEAVAGITGVDSCTGISVTIPAGSRDAALSVEVTNPAPADCESSTLEIAIEEPPRIDDVQPLKICSTGGALTLTGDHFADGMTVTLDGVAAVTVVVSSPQQAVATWEGPLAAGLATLVAANPSGCDDTFATEIRVTDGPVVFFVDPPVVYSGIATQVTVFLGNLFGGSVQEVRVTDSNGNVTVLEHTFDAAQPGRVQAVMPLGLPADSYDVTLVDEVNCQGTTADLVRVTDTIEVSVGAITPPFGWTSSVTPVVIETDDPVPNNEVTFDPTPRVYINPENPTADDVAVELRAAILVSPNELNGVVSSGLPIGRYDVIVVNPDGGVGLLESGFEVTAEAPPTVNAVSPGSWQTNNNALPVTVEGANLRDATVTATCIDNNGNALPAPAINTTTDSAAQLTLSVNTSTLSHLSVCVLRITNSDGTYEDFSPITVTNPAGNFVGFRTGMSMQTPRRAPAVVSGVPSRAARFLYALGGDSGAAASALATGEYTLLNRFGEPTGWEPLPADLPAPVTLSKAVRIDDFLYLPGGSDGTGPTADVRRALVLDPLNVPRITSVDFDFLDTGDGLGTGVYTYRVSAVLAADNAANPDGETLASEPQPVFIPDLPQAVVLQLGWPAFADAVSYRIYRSPMPDILFGQEELLAEIPATQTTFLDDGTGTTDPAGTALPIGALGRWHVVASLDTARHSHGVTTLVSPDGPNLRVIYAGGGIGAAGTLSSLEAITIQVNGPRDQVVLGVVGATLPQAKSELELVVADSSNASRVGGTAYVYAMAGKGPGGSSDNTLSFAAIGMGGLPGMFAPISATFNPFRAGYAATIANNTVVAVGGQNGAPNNSGRDGTIAANGDITGSTSLASTGMRERYLMGRATFGGFFYVLGGQTGTEAASATLDFSVLGGVP